MVLGGFQGSWALWGFSGAFREIILELFGTFLGDLGEFWGELLGTFLGNSLGVFLGGFFGAFGDLFGNSLGAFQETLRSFLGGFFGSFLGILQEFFWSFSGAFPCFPGPFPCRASGAGGIRARPRSLPTPGRLRSRIPEGIWLRSLLPGIVPGQFQPGMAPLERGDPALCRENSGFPQGFPGIF